MFNDLRVREKIFLITSLIMLGVCLTSMAAFRLAGNVYEERIYTEAAEVLRLTSSHVDFELREMEELSFQVGTDVSIQQYLALLGGEEANYESFKVRTSLYERMMYFMQRENNVSNLEITDAHGNRYMTVLNNAVGRQQELERIALQAAGRNVWIPGDGDSETLIGVRQIRGMANVNLAHYGTLFMQIDMEKLVERFLDRATSKIFVISQNGNTIFSNKPELVDERIIHEFQGKSGYAIESMNGSKFLVSYVASQHHKDLRYYNILPYEVVSRQTERISMTMLFFFAVLFLLALLVSRFASRSITKPLSALADKMKRAQMGNFAIAYAIEDDFPNKDETGQLHRNFRTMMEKINELFEENYEKQRIIHETEYRALQAQINPHFLYNTLETVNWMAKMNDQPRISEVVEALGHMLRNVISRKGPLIPLAEELNIVRDYVTIQKHRFDERLDFRMTVEPGAEECLVPKLTIQPLVENAIQHVLEKARGTCRIEVDIREEGGCLRMSVSNSGPGMAPDKLAALRLGELPSKKTGIGLKNIEERIHLMFGQTHGMTIDSDAERGTRIMIQFPFTRGE